MTTKELIIAATREVNMAQAILAEINTNGSLDALKCQRLHDRIQTANCAVIELQNRMAGLPEVKRVP